MSETEERGWRDIQTAPRDGSEFLGYDASAKKFDVCVMQDINTREPLWVARQVQMDGEYGPESDEFGYDWKNITHWMPLPAPPPKSV